MELCDRTVAELSVLLTKREISAVEIVQSAFDRIEASEKVLNAYITLTKGHAFEQAKIADEKLSKGETVNALTGIPIAIKDNLCTDGVKTTCGSRILENYVPPYNSTAVQKVLSDGAVLIGKTNLDEFGMGSSTENSAFGPTKNPVNTDYVAGGSSGGSAAAVASGEAIVALGTDTGGSIRMPASFCGVVGIKPTYGRVSRYGLISYASSLDQIGAFGKTVKDCAFVLNSICGYDSMDSTSANVQVPDFVSSLNQNLKNVKIGLPKEYFVEGIDPRIKEKILKVVDQLEANGANIYEISLPNSRYAISAYYLIATAEASSNLARYDGVKYGFRATKNVKDTMKMYEESRFQGFGNEVKRRVILGSYVLSAGYFDAYYLKAQKIRTLINNDFNNAFEKVDCLIAPVTPTIPFKLGEKLAEPLQMYLMDIFTVSLNLAGLPGLSMNCGKVDGLPVGFQIIGKPFDEQTILNVGDAYEQIRES